MAWVKEFSAASSGTGNSINVTVPTGGVPIGHFLVVGIGAAVNTNYPNWLVTDTRSNSWTNEHMIPLTGSFGGATLYTCKVTTALLAGDTITVSSSSGSVQRLAVGVEEFDDNVNAFDTKAVNEDTSTTTVVTSGSFTTSHANELLVTVLYFVNQARVLTPSAGWTPGTKIVTTAGSGNRAVQLLWRSVSSTGSYTAGGTFDLGGNYAIIAASYELTIGGGGGSRTGNAKVWNGSSWVSHPVKVWNGSAWVDHDIKGYDGSTWIVGK